MMSDIRTIILIYLIKICFSYLFSTSVAAVVQAKKYSENSKQKFKDRIKSNLETCIFFAFSRKKKIKLPESMWEKSLKQIWNM